jgi:class 3 adenylate cyclase/tetratricopeptide (TPR) repeat protein
MRCQNCGTENPRQARFCIECGGRLNQRCPNCGADNPAAAKFCAECAASLRQPDAAPVDGGNDTQIQGSAEGRQAEAHPGPIPEAGRPAHGERRHLSVLFCDLVGSTEIAGSLDPEEWRDIAARYQRSAADAASRLGGHVAKYLGDGLVIYFGYPHAHENDAERAVRAGLAILNAVATLNEQLAAEKHPRLRTRVAIHAGFVVVGEGGGREPDVFGEAPNIAARVQALADPDTVLITASIHRLVSGLFVLEDRGVQSLKGVAAPVQLYRVLQPSGVRGRSHAVAAARGLTPFVGREGEFRMLQNRWERVLDGEGQLVMLVGEAGIGKSRLVQQFHDQISGTPHTWIECEGTPFLQNTPFHCVSEMLQQAFASSSDVSADERLGRLERALESAGIPLGESVPLIAPLLNLSVPDRYPLSLLPPEQQHRRLQATLVRWVFSAARLQPLVIAVEDLHWVDPSTLDFLQLLAEQGATAAVLLLCTARSEFRPPWPIRAHHVQMPLNRLSNHQVREFVIQMAGAKSLAPDVVDAVVVRTGGVPLFIEELTRLVVEGGKGAIASDIPATLHDSLMARLDRLGPAKEVVQVGAAIGREFSFELIRAVLPISDTELQAGLEKAADAELLYIRGMAPDATYLFKHALVQDIAYQALLKSKRRELHHTIAKVLNERFADKVSVQPELVAHHFSEAGDVQEALSAWQRAGESAVARGALKEAESHYVRAIAVLDTIGDAPGTAQKRLFLQVAFGQVLMATKGYAAKEVQEAYKRARELGEQLGDPAQLLFALMGVWVSNLTRNELAAAQAVADQILAAAERDGGPALMVWGHHAIGVTCYHRGDLIGAHTHLERAAALYDEQEHTTIPHDPGVVALSYASRTAWQLGMADTARALIQRALALALRLKKPFPLAFVHSIAAGVHLWLREPERAQQFAEALIELAAEQHMPFYAADGAILRGRALADLGHCTDAIEFMREGIAHHVSNGQRGGLGFYLAFLAEAQMLAGAFDEALTSAEEGFAAGPEERVDHPHLLYLRGEIQLRRSASEQLGKDRARDCLQLAEQNFRQAMEVARQIRAKSFELRAATSFGRMLKSLGRTTEARELLAPLYRSFTEGFDTADLKEAKALLDELTCPG